MTLISLNKGQGHSIILVPIDFLYATSYSLAVNSRIHRLATILHVTDRQTDDGRNTVPIARPVRSAKNQNYVIRLHVAY